MANTSLKEWKEAGKTAFRMLLYFAVFYLLGYVVIILPLVLISKSIPQITGIIPKIFSFILIFAFFISVSKVIQELIGNAGYMPKQKENINVKPLKIEVKK